MFVMIFIDDPSGSNNDAKQPKALARLWGAHEIVDEVVSNDWQLERDLETRVCI